jgi:hypothetical protein
MGAESQQQQQLHQPLVMEEVAGEEEFDQEFDPEKGAPTLSSSMLH